MATPPAAPPSPEHVLEPHPTGMFAALGRFDYRFRKRAADSRPGAGHRPQRLGRRRRRHPDPGWLGHPGLAGAAGGGRPRRSDSARPRRPCSSSSRTRTATPRRRPSRRTVKDSLGDISNDPDVERVVTYADAPAPALLVRGRHVDPGRRLPEQGGRVGGRGFRPPGRCGGSAGRRGGAGHRHPAAVPRVQPEDRAGPGHGGDDQPADRAAHPAGGVRHAGGGRAAAADRRARHADRASPSSACWHQ